jgi:hypothetical protein
MIRKESELARGTHSLERTEPWRSEDRERKRAIGTHFLRAPSVGQVRTRGKASERGALTDWRGQCDDQVRTRKESEWARGTHELEDTQQRTSENTERKRASEGHSLPEEGRATDK